MSHFSFQMKKKSAPAPQQQQFSMNAVPPPNFEKKRFSSGSAGGGSLSKQGYTTMASISQFASSQLNSSAKRKSRTEDEWFDDDDDAGASAAPELAYIPAPGSPSAAPKEKQPDSDDSEDELDLYMKALAQETQKSNKTTAPVSAFAAKSSGQQKGVRNDIEEMDDEESYYRFMEENPNAGVVVDENSDGEQIEYDEDGNPIAPSRKRDIDPLPPIDHSLITYEPFEKNFYTPHEEILALDGQQVNELRQTLGIKVTGPAPPSPVSSFAHFGFDEQLIKAIRKSAYTQPTPIQAQAIPALLGGRDVIGIAKTGSGKTAAFLWPMLIHIMDQKELQPGDGPIGLILAPTRELSIQIYNEAKKFGKVYNIQVVCAYGGGSKWEQSKALEAGAEIVVATPGRMIDLVKMKATKLDRVTYLVLDEADKMFNMGFEAQVRSICDHVRPDRQCCLFSATFKKRIEKLARDILVDPIRIVQGEIGEANEDVTQRMLVFHNPAQKWTWLLTRLVELLSDGSVLIFVTKKADAEQVANNLKLKEYDALLLHGDMDQADRNKVITAFKKKEAEILVATDVAARGLDIPHVKTVVNYDIARDIDTHTHRVGRTGRAGEKGTAYTLVSDKDKEFAGHLVRNLEGANQEVPKELMDLAMQSSWFRKSRFKSGKGKSLTAGLGYRSRPGLGSSDGGGSGGGSSKKTDMSSGPSKSSSSLSAGAPMNRLEAMREAFKAQYNTQFKASTDRTWEQTQNAPTFAKPEFLGADATGGDGTPAKKAKKSRWD